MAATTTTPASWNANATTTTTTPGPVNTTPDARVSRVTKRRTRSGMGRWRALPQARFHPDEAANSTTSLVLPTPYPPGSAPRTRMAGSHHRPRHLHTFPRWTKRWDPIAPAPSFKPEVCHKSPTTSIDTLTNRWRVTRCRRQHPKSHGDAENERSGADGEDSRWGRGTMDVQGSRGGAVTLLALLIYVVTCKV